MKLPRDLSGDDVARLLCRCYGYRIARQSGSHMMLTVVVRNAERQITVPQHRYVRIGTLGSIVADVADQLGVTREEVRRRLFGR